MALFKLTSAATLGIDVVPVDVEVDASFSEELEITIVGLPDTAVKESRDRVLAAIKNSGIRLKPFRATINLAPGNIKKEGPIYDLPIALALLAALGGINKESLHDFLALGELSLFGEIRSTAGAFAFGALARQLGKKGLIVPRSNAQEAYLAFANPVIAENNLQLTLEALNQKKTSTFSQQDRKATTALDFADIKGQFFAKRALEVAAAGGHNALLFGPPGSGKTLLAKAFPSILPPLSEEESLEVTKIHSIAGTLKEPMSLIQEPPIRSPHHTISQIGMIGGSMKLRPGEVTLAHHGVLFLDELTEFSRATLEALRQPLEDHSVSLSRALSKMTFPSRFIFLAAMNPCPCGFYGHPTKLCKDTPLSISRYQNKVSGPLLDRIDLQIEVGPVSFQDWKKKEEEEKSDSIRKRVEKARLIQKARFSSSKLNSHMTPKEIKTFAPLDSEGEELLKTLQEKFDLSLRLVDKLIKVSRTIADLEGCELITQAHLMESASLRLQLQSASLV